MEPKTITATELARNLSDILSRVKYRGETYVIERNGEPVARLEPGERKARTVGEVVLEVGDWRVPTGLSDDMEDAFKVLETALPAPPSWPS